ncbi:FecR family protein [Chitinophaga caseinilytica]|uniref:FecR domain-containing protein n=1 Tax=Chitinophaga caseinilytica TaxID=2267521 RepID=A0ABZ2Z9Q0_9BACT
MADQTFTLEYFLSQPGFREWVLEKDPRATEHWEDWARRHPEHAATIQAAADWLLITAAQQAAPPAQLQEATWERIVASIEEAPRRRPMMRWMPWAAAAVVIGILAMILLPKKESEAFNTVSTAFGEVKTISLPDGSEIRLNVNSTVKYAVSWEGDSAREVWLGGEAFFEVKHESGNRKFIVHTNDVDIQVVGTAFNVNTRRVQTQVVLQNGKVNLKLNRKDTSLIAMRPGDMVTWSAERKELSNNRVDPGHYAAWQQQRLIFQDATLADVLLALEENTGIKVQLEDSAMLKETFTGTIPTDHIDVFFKTLSRSFDITITENGKNRYVIRKGGQ